MDYAVEIGKILREKNLKISTTESCTGGLLSSRLTDVAGSSEYITLNLITYANKAKEEMLGVILDSEGAVSENCAKQMAIGLHKLTKSDICVSTTGIAGPGGGTEEKPVGLMYSAIYSQNNLKTYKIQISSELTRVEIKNKFTEKVLENIYNFLTSQS